MKATRKSKIKQFCGECGKCKDCSLPKEDHMKCHQPAVVTNPAVIWVNPIYYPPTWYPSWTYPGTWCGNTITVDNSLLGSNTTWNWSSSAIPSSGHYV